MRVSTAGTLCLPVKERAREIERERERNTERRGGAGGDWGGREWQLILLVYLRERKGEIVFVRKRDRER